jgi:uncharacterized RDD family membrane protein YckC
MDEPRGIDRPTTGQDDSEQPAEAAPAGDERLAATDEAPDPALVELGEAVNRREFPTDEEAPPPPPPPAPLGKRVFAAVVDAFVVAAIMLCGGVAALSAGLFSGSFLLYLIVAAGIATGYTLYDVLESATPAKAWLGLVITRPGGKPASSGQRMARWALGHALPPLMCLVWEPWAWIGLGIWYLINCVFVFASRDHQAVWDMLAGTVVADLFADGEPTPPATRGFEPMFHDRAPRG